MWAPRGLAGLGEPRAALPWQRRDVGERSPVPAPHPPSHCFHFLHPGTFKLLALLSRLSPHALPHWPQERGWKGPCPGRAWGSPGPPDFSLWQAASALMSNICLA